MEQHDSGCSILLLCRRCCRRWKAKQSCVSGFGWDPSIHPSIFLKSGTKVLRNGVGSEGWSWYDAVKHIDVDKRKRSLAAWPHHWRLLSCVHFKPKRARKHGQDAKNGGKRRCPPMVAQKQPYRPTSACFARTTWQKRHRQL